VGVAEGQQHDVGEAVEGAVHLGAVAAAVDHADPALHGAQLADDLVQGFRRAGVGGDVAATVGLRGSREVSVSTQAERWPSRPRPWQSMWDRVVLPVPPLLPMMQMIRDMVETSR
jgi:hypothetical protein